MACAALTGPTPWWLVGDDGQQPAAVVFELAPGLDEGVRHAADLGLADRVLTAGMSWEFPPGEGDEGRLAQRPAGSAAVMVATG
jgi:hypothetical protein